ncbi:helix-turn-helix domain-containing protein [Suttonella ornithocola]
MRLYSLELRKKVIAKLAEGYSVRQVVNNFGIHFPTVQKWKMRDCL